MLHRLTSILLLGTLAGAQGQVATPAPWLLFAADADGDLETTRAEWEAFAASLPTTSDGAFDRSIVLARGMRSSLGPGRGLDLARADFERVLRAESPERGDAFLSQVAQVAADADLDGQVSEAEASAFLASMSEQVTNAELGRILGLATRGTTADRNAMSASVVLLGNDSALDADLNGRIDGADLEAHFAALDADSNGAVTPAERRAARRAPTTRGFSVSEDAVDPEARMPWQRSLADAQLLSQRTGKPVLLCVNMDGEAASDALALGRYRNPEFIALVEGFVPLIASPDRRNPQDRDDRGARIEDPRFGRVLNSEAVDIEPSLYERYFNGRRVAPRHVAVAPDGTILFDIFLINDLSIIDRALKEHGVFEEPIRAADSTEVALLDSPDAGDRTLLEERFLAGDRRTRTRLAGLALSAVREVQHPGLLRMALMDRDPAVQRAALGALTLAPEDLPLELFSSAWRLSRGSEIDRGQVLAALEKRRYAETDEALRGRAGRQLAALRGITRTSSALDLDHWLLTYELEGARSHAVAAEDYDATVDLVERVMDRLVEAREDPARLRDAAAAQLRFADATLAIGGNPTFAFQDARDLARKALAADPDSARSRALLAIALYMGGEDGTSEAAEALANLGEAAASPLAFRTLEVLARGRTTEVYAAMRANEVWDSALLPDLVAAWKLIAAHPDVSEGQVTAFLDLLGSIELYGEQKDELLVALDRTPESPVLHNYLRFVCLRDEGALGLMDTYEALVDAATEADHATTLWFAGMSGFVGAEHLIQRNQTGLAYELYQTAIQRFRRSLALEEEYADSANHYLCLSLAGRARLELQADRLDAAVASITEAVVVRPTSATSTDGLGNTPMGTARLIEERLDAEGDGEKLEGLRAALGREGIEGYP